MPNLTTNPNVIGAAKTAVLEVRADMRDIATILSYYKRNGVPMRSRSDLVAMALHDFADMLAGAGLQPIITSTEQALNILETVFGSGSMNHAARGTSNLQRQLQYEAQRTMPASVRQATSTMTEFIAGAELIDLNRAAALLEENMAKADAQLQAGLATLPTAVPAQPSEVEDE